MSDLLARVFEACGPMRGLGDDSSPGVGTAPAFDKELEGLEFLAIAAGFVEFPPKTPNRDLLINLTWWTGSHDGSAPVRGRRYILADVREGHIRRALGNLREGEDLIAPRPLAPRGCAMRPRRPGALWSSTINVEHG
jgi:hypothetical protein